ncbi:hypothetical protein ARMSODRAFT_1024556 [Armillaria solidipes]|uniref:Uncharacterized protein n=1 Tax=Armillaria solidipes TaxID=1076256 RepID=A0A2H3B9Q2_9AGAR|nr:hypothetical protein ARMSODRAFT_1024556 [Armillaria solidipes]
MACLRSRCKGERDRFGVFLDHHPDSWSGMRVLGACNAVAKTRFPLQLRDSDVRNRLLCYLWRPEIRDGLIPQCSYGGLCTSALLKISTKMACPRYQLAPSFRPLRHDLASRVFSRSRMTKHETFADADDDLDWARVSPLPGIFNNGSKRIL